jgi:hypothetical protein
MFIIVKTGPFSPRNAIYNCFAWIEAQAISSLSQLKVAIRNIAAGLLRALCAKKKSGVGMGVG